MRNPADKICGSQCGGDVKSLLKLSGDRRRQQPAGHRKVNGRKDLSSIINVRRNTVKFCSGMLLFSHSAAHNP
jgi:hypothetical protein